MKEQGNTKRTMHLTKENDKKDIVSKNSKRWAFSPPFISFADAIRLLQKTTFKAQFHRPTIEKR